MKSESSDDNSTKNSITTGINTITLTGKRSKNVNQLKTAIEKLGFREIDIDKNDIKVKIVERETIKGTPYLYMNITLENERLIAEFNLPKDYSPALRKFEVVSLLLRILLLTDAYETKPEKIYKMIFNVFDVVHDTLTKDYSTLKSQYDLLLEEHRKLKNKTNEMDKINEKINKTMLEIETRNQQLVERVKTLESVSDETLEEVIIDWLRTNRGILNVNEFAKINNISAGRVEEGIDSLLKKGIIERIK